MEKSYSSHFRSNMDLNIINYGAIEMQPGQEIVNDVFLHNCIYYIVEGRVRFNLNGKYYDVVKDELFLSPASYSSGFICDEGCKSVVYWVSFWGLKAKEYLDIANLTVYRPLYVCSDDTLYKHMKTLVEECGGYHAGGALKATGCLYMILADLASSSGRKLTDRQQQKALYAQKAVEFIRTNYMNDISVGDISRHVALNRTYFSSLFKEVIGISPIDYLIKYRIDQSIILMVNPLLSISDIATLVGFSDLVSFSIRFKSLTLRAPSDYRKDMFDHTTTRIRNTKKLPKTPDKN